MKRLWGKFVKMNGVGGEVVGEVLSWDGDVAGFAQNLGLAAMIGIEERERGVRRLIGQIDGKDAGHAFIIFDHRGHARAGVGGCNGEAAGDGGAVPDSGIWRRFGFDFGY